MTTYYKTSEVASIIGIHPNTVRLYEKLALITTPERLPNGYRVFTELHIQQCRLVRLAFEVELVQNGLRRKMVKIVKLSAAGDYDAAILLTKDYLKQIQKENANAEEAIEIVKQIITGTPYQSSQSLRRKEVSELLGVSMDALRNWEMNGLLTVRRKENGYRVYTSENIQRLKIIRSLRCANYSLESILRLLQQLSENPNENIDIKTTLNTPKQTDDTISVCDKLIISLLAAEKNARMILHILNKLKK